MRGTSTTDWGSTAQSLHWIVVLLILGIVLQQVHQTLGFTIFALVVMRLIWRARNAVPAAPADQPAWQRGLGRLTHYGLYALLLLFPLSGWASLSVYRGVLLRMWPGTGSRTLSESRATDSR